MKIVFDRLQTQKETISIKFSDTYTQEVNVNDAVENGVHIDPDNCSDLDHIIIENSIKPSYEGLNDKFKAIKRYISVKFEELDNYLQSLEDNTPETSYKIKVIDIPESGIGESYDSGTLGTILRSNYTKYVSLKFDHSLDNVTDATGMFSDCIGLTNIDTSSFTNVTNAKEMFRNCSNLTTIDTSGFTNVTDTNFMFDECRGLTSIDTAPFTNVTHADGMFNCCEGLTNIDTSGFINVTTASWMFRNCKGLTKIDTSAFTNVTNAYGMFCDCTGLTKIDTTPFTNVTDADQMFYGCTLTVYYSSEYNNFYKNYKSKVSGNITWALK